MIRTVVALTGAAALAIAGVAHAAPGEAQTGEQNVTVQIWLTSDLAGAARFATAVSTPGSPDFHHYLSPNAYTARFGPSAATANAVSDWLRHRGMTDVQVSSGRDYISASGPVSKLQSVPPSLAPNIMSVTGLGNEAAPRSASVARRQPTCSAYWAQHVRTVSPSYRGFAKASLPVCGYSAQQLRAAYGASWAATGRGQTVALTESEAPTNMAQTLREYARRNHLPAPKPNQFREIHVGSCGTKTQRTRSAQQYNDEAEMDSEAVYAMAPAANQLMVVGSGCDEDQALLNAVLAVLTGDGHRPSASIVSNSWQIPIGDVSPKTWHAITLRAAAEGVGLYLSSGDTPGLTMTASDPLVTAVGGTTLGLDARSNRVFETGWSNGSAMFEDRKWSELGITGAGGGTSLVYAQPAYQKGVVPASMSHVRVGGRTVVNRAVPDLAAVADLDTGMLTGYTTLDDKGKPTYRTMVNAGTSLSAPLVAGLIAGAQQGRRTPFGFINPLLYRLHGTRAINDVLPINKAMPQQNRAAYTPATATDSATIDVFDSHNPTDTDQTTVKGYDTTTGIGTPNGLPFILGLRYLAK
ncbi:S53 family peptidase [Kribbella solani]|uniref:Subtilase family serine protease n=1 Tax=Kribbella solani TaxID=236067 RepID=A0A841E5W1_9ACTN|nr:S53 family serine peptidase [Kribbella solani]MBB5983737.1 subtilase family serine protease [Kribbella solani]